MKTGANDAAIKILLELRAKVIREFDEQISLLREADAVSGAVVIGNGEDGFSLDVEPVHKVEEFDLLETAIMQKGKFF